MLPAYIISGQKYTTYQNKLNTWNTTQVVIHISVSSPDQLHNTRAISGLILGLHPANERYHYKVTPSLIGRAQIHNQPCRLHSTPGFPHAPPWSSHLQCCSNSHLMCQYWMMFPPSFTEPWSPHCFSWTSCTSKTCPTLPYRPPVSTASVLFLLLHSSSIILFTSSLAQIYLSYFSITLSFSLPCLSQTALSHSCFLRFSSCFFTCYHGPKLFVPSSVPPPSSLLLEQSPHWVKTLHIVLPNILHFIPPY